MRNLKRALSLVMAMALIVGMMVVSASAASKDFTDAGEIDHTEAVNTMVALNVISGKDDGSYFDPEGTLTRAEMAKVVAFVMNGGVEPNIGTKVVPTYSDIDNHWAEAYIEYCTSMGIIAGDGAGKFNPGGPLTAEQTAKMFLTAMGYNAEVFGLVGANWAMNVGRYANEAGLYKELGDITPSQPISRDDAAQMAYNAIQSALMVRGWQMNQATGQVTETYNLAIDADGKITRTLLSERFNAMTFVGTLNNNANTKSSLKDGQIEIYGKLTTASENATKVNANFTADVDISNIGEEYKVIFKDGTGGTPNKPDDKDTIYGVFKTGNTEVLTAVKADIGDQKSSDAVIVVDGTEYTTEDSVKVYNNYINTVNNLDADNGNSTTNSALTTNLKVQNGDTIKFVFNEDGKIFAAYVTGYDAGRVTAVTSTKVTISGVGSIAIADNDLYDGIALDDVVTYTKFYSTDKDKAYFTVAKAETVEGKLDGYKIASDTLTYQNVVVDGETYKIDTPATSLTALSDDGYTALTDADVGSTVRLYLMNGMVVGIDEVSEGASQYAVVTDIAEGSLTSTLEPIRVSLLFADGSEATKIIHKDSTTDGSTRVAYDSMTKNIGEGSLVKYTLSGDDQIKISAVQTKTAGNTVADDQWNADSKRLTYNNNGAEATGVAASNAVAFVKVGTDYYAFSLRTLKDIDVANKVSTAMLNSDGLVAASYMELNVRPSGGTANTIYGIVSGYVGVRAIGGDNYDQYTVDTSADNSVTVNLPINSSLATGALVYFDESADGTYNTGDIRVLAVNGTTVGAVAVKSYDAATGLLTGYNGTDRNSVSEAFAGTGAVTAYTLDKDVKIVYVDADGKKGGEEIGVTAFDGNTGYANVLVANTDGDADGVIDVIFVETSGETNIVSSVAGSFGVKNNMVSISVPASITKTNTYTASGSASVEAGAAFTVSVNCTVYNNTVESVDVIYNGDTQTLTFSGTGTQSVTFTAVAGQTSVTLA